MAGTIKIDELADTIQHELEMYCDEVQENLDYAADIVSKQLLVDIKEDCPEDKGAYTKSWTRKKKAHSYLVYNKKYGWLTHLLEFGHQLRNGGRAKAKPHILKNAERAANSFENLAVSIISEGVRLKK